MKDYFGILQVSPDAEQEVIEAAYRQLARKYHPDVYSGPDAAQRMRELNEAYEVLGDPRKRAEYRDALGRAWARPHAGRGRGIRTPLVRAPGRAGLAVRLDAQLKPRVPPVLSKGAKVIAAAAHPTHGDQDTQCDPRTCDHGPCQA